MRLIFALLSPLWLFQAPLANRMIAWHGKMIGGAQYFDHMGVRTYISAIETLSMLSLTIAGLLLAAAVTTKLPTVVVFVCVLVFSAVALLAYSPAVLGIGLLQARVFPYEMRSDIYLVLAVAAVKLLALLPQVIVSLRARSDR